MRQIVDTANERMPLVSLEAFLEEAGVGIGTGLTVMVEKDEPVKENCYLLVSYQVVVRGSGSKTFYQWTNLCEPDVRWRKDCPGVKAACKAAIDNGFDLYHLENIGEFQKLINALE